MPAEQTFLFDRIEGIEEDPPQLTVSGEDERVYCQCMECAKVNGRHHSFCVHAMDLWDEEYNATLLACKEEDVATDLKMMWKHY